MPHSWLQPQPAAVLLLELRVEDQDPLHVPQKIKDLGIAFWLFFVVAYAFTHFNIRMFFFYSSLS